MSSLIKRNKIYHLRWYQDKNICPSCNGKKIVGNKSCRRCRGTGEIYQEHEKAISPDRRTALEYKVEFDRKFFRNELGLRDTNKSWASFIEEYLTYSKANKRPATHTIDTRSLKTFSDIIKPSKFADINSQKIEQWKQERLKSVSSAQANKEFRHLKSALSKAVQWKYLNNNPAKYVKQSKIPKNQPRFLTTEEIKKLLEIADDKMKLIIPTFIYTGLRISELINLRWQDIDFKQRELVIQSHDDFQPKDYEARTIPIHDDLFKILYPVKKENGIVFTNGNSEKYSISVLEKKLQKLTKEAGISNCSPHTLRHTYASHLVMSGGDLVTIKELLGHSSIVTTMIYAHLSKPHIKKIVDNLHYNL